MKKVLIISYYWPPSGGIGVHRCLKFSKYLRLYGWEPIVYTPKNAQYPYFDLTNEKHVPEDLTVLRTKIFEPFDLFKKLSGRKKHESANPVYVRDRKLKTIDKLAIWIRGNLFIPDARCFWIKPSLKFLKNYLKDNPVDAIFTDGPPHTNTVIGCKLSKITGIPWLADYQDPWTQVDYYSMLKIGKRADAKHRKLEQEAFKTAKKTTTVSPSWKTDLESIGAKNVDVLFWAYDEQDFPKNKIKDDDLFTIVHAGQLGYDRRPDTLLKVLSDLISENKDFRNKLKIKFAGTVDFAIKQQIINLGLENNYEYLGNIPRPEAIELCLKSHVQLLPLNIADNAKGRIPGKLFENMRACKPILCLGPINSDVADILNETEAGECIEYNDYDRIKSFILSCFSKYLNGKSKIESRNIEAYEIKNIVKKLARFLDEISG